MGKESDAVVIGGSKGWEMLRSGHATVEEAVAINQQEARLIVQEELAAQGRRIEPDRGSLSLSKRLMKLGGFLTRANQKL